MLVWEFRTPGWQCGLLLESSYSINRAVASWDKSVIQNRTKLIASFEEKGKWYYRIDLFVRVWYRSIKKRLLEPDLDLRCGAFCETMSRNRFFEIKLFYILLITKQKPHYLKTKLYAIFPNWFFQKRTTWWRNYVKTWARTLTWIEKILILYW